MGLRRSCAIAVLVAAGAVLTACGAVVPGTPRVATASASDLALIHAYVDGFNAAGRAGVDAQTAYLRATQEPNTPFPSVGCIGRLVLETRLVERTVRPDAEFTAPRAGGAPTRPPGAVYVVAASVSASQGGVTVRQQIGSQHLVIHDGRAFGYSPCSD